MGSSSKGKNKNNNAAATAAAAANNNNKKAPGTSSSQGKKTVKASSLNGVKPSAPAVQNGKRSSSNKVKTAEPPPSPPLKKTLLVTPSSSSSLFRKILLAFCYLVSFSVIGLAGLLGTLMYMGSKPNNISIQIDSKPLFPPIQLTAEQIRDYQRDGTVRIPNFLSTDQATQVRNAIEQAPTPLAVWEATGFSNYAKLKMDVWRVDATIAQLVLKDLPAVVAQLLSPNPKKRSAYRLLKDGYFAYSNGGNGCGWHVDDETFWPTVNDTSGITLWIALDDMIDGGGLFMANRTFIGPDVVKQCRAAIAGRTCSMATVSPECHRIMENAKIDWKLRAGDAVLWDRWVFHRTDATSVADNAAANPKRRYSVRYMPASSRASGVVHHTIDQGDLFWGSPYYPQVLPTLVDSEIKALEHGLDSEASFFNFVTKNGKKSAQFLLLVLKMRGMQAYQKAKAFIPLKL